MRLSDYSRLAFGKDSDNLSDEERKDIIYKVYLGDRQVWRKGRKFPKNIAIENPALDEKLRMTWHVYDYLVLGNVTSATSITGTIYWGDGSSESWKSGNIYYHKYFGEGDYDVTIKCSNYLPLATIGQIVSLSSTRAQLVSYLKKISFCKIPYLETRLWEACYGGADEHLPMFYNYRNLEEVQVPNGVSNIPARMFAYTNLEKVILGTTLSSIGEEAFLRRQDETIEDSDKLLTIIINKDDKINNLSISDLANSKLGYKKGIGEVYSKISNIKLICPNDLTSIINYFESEFNAEIESI